jgi:hypothetical protein
MYTLVTYWDDEETQTFDGYVTEEFKDSITVCSPLCMAWLVHLKQVEKSNLIQGWGVPTTHIATQKSYDKIYHAFDHAIFDFFIPVESIPELQQICLFFEHYYFNHKHFSVSESLERSIQKVAALLPHQTIKDLLVFILDLVKAYEQNDRLETLFSPIISKYV